MLFLKGLTYFSLWYIFYFSAERRAQLARSRSRQNIFQAQSPDVVREITFDDSTMGGPGGDVMTPTRPARSKRSQKRRPLANGDINSNNKSSLDAAGSEQFTEAEQLLMRLKALWLVKILKPSHSLKIEH